MILLQAPHTGVLPLSSGACCAACRMELRFCIGVGWTGCWCWVTTVLVLSGLKRSAKFGSVTHGGRLEGPELRAAAAAAAVLEPGPETDTEQFVLELQHNGKTWQRLNNFTSEGQLYVMHTLAPDVCCDSFVCHIVVGDSRVLTLKNKESISTTSTGCCWGFLFTHQREQKLTIWFICC